MLQASVLRLEGLEERDRTIAVANESHRFLVAQQLREAGLPESDLILEPAGRNTAPAVAVAAMTALQRDADAVLLVTPADHVIRDDEAFRDAVRTGLPSARAGRLVVFGIVPERPETGYGYIRTDASQGDVRRVAEFVEKPDAQRAEAFVASGDYFWNSGIFLLGARRYLEELGRHRPEILAACESAFGGTRRDLDFLRLEETAFDDCPAESIDYAVMENTADAAMVPLGCGWSDVGSWTALQEESEPTEDGNVLVGDVIAEGASNSYIHSQGRLIAAIGTRDQVIVETPDAVLVAARERVQDVRDLVGRLRSSGRAEIDVHREVFRPWGSYEGIAQADRFQVKRIVVSPGQRLSLQMHHHRAEHWIVVRGTARVTRDDETFLLSEDQSTYLPLGARHCLENPGVIPLELIEVQTGSYLGEDDIVRYDDIYGRVEAAENKEPAGA